MTKVARGRARNVNSKLEHFPREKRLGLRHELKITLSAIVIA